MPIGKRTLPEVLKMERVALGLTQREFAKILGKDQSWIARVELGSLSVPASFLPTYAKALGIELWRLHRQIPRFMTAAAAA